MLVSDKFLNVDLCFRTIYRKWNLNLFEEMHKAYVDGRSGTDPSLGWYEGELKFFDGHVIPLAKRLISCQCFGVGADEFLASAEQNRAEWAEKGREIVAEMVTDVKTKKAAQIPGAASNKTTDSVTSNTTSKTSETRNSTSADAHYSSSPVDLLARTIIADVVEEFEDELEIGSNGSVAC